MNSQTALPHEMTEVWDGARAARVVLSTALALVIAAGFGLWQHTGHSDAPPRAVHRQAATTSAPRIADPRPWAFADPQPRSTAWDLPPEVYLVASLEQAADEMQSPGLALVANDDPGEPCRARVMVILDIADETRAYQYLDGLDSVRWAAGLSPVRRFDLRPSEPSPTLPRADPTTDRHDMTVHCGGYKPAGIAASDPR